MKRIFISYRRGESSPYAQMLFDFLGQHFGEENVFYDRKAIEPGLDFREVIRQELNSCDALIALIGQQWLMMKSPAGVRRIDEPADIVHQEIATALTRNIRLIPVLVQGVAMPRHDELPGPLSELSFRNALELTDAKWEFDKQRLVEIIEKIFSRSGSGPTTVSPSSRDALPVETLLKKALLCKNEADELFADTDTAARTAKLQQAYEHLQKANEMDPANTKVLLEMARLLMELTPDDPADEAKLFRRIKKLLAHPNTDTERFHLAQATFLLATSSEPVDTASIEEARDSFAELGKKDWVRQCDVALNVAESARPEEKSETAALPPRLPPEQPSLPTAASFVGRWHVEIMALIKSTMTLDLYPNGVCHGVQQIPFVGPVGFQGNWGYDPYGRMLQLQCMVQFQPFNLGIVIQGPRGNGYQGMGTDGFAYHFTRG